MNKLTLTPLLGLDGFKKPPMFFDLEEEILFPITQKEPLTGLLKPVAGKDRFVWFGQEVLTTLTKRTILNRTINPEYVEYVLDESGRTIETKLFDFDNTGRRFQTNAKTPQHGLNVTTTLEAQRFLQTQNEVQSLKEKIDLLMTALSAKAEEVKPTILESAKKMVGLCLIFGILLFSSCSVSKTFANGSCRVETFAKYNPETDTDSIGLIVSCENQKLKENIPFLLAKMNLFANQINRSAKW